MRGDSVVRRESMRVRKDGNTIHVALTVSPIKDQEGRVMGLPASCGHYGRKLMEDALRHSEASYRSFVENAPFGIVRSTPDGTIVQANPALVQMLGYTSEQEVLGLHMATDVYHDSEEREVATAWSGDKTPCKASKSIGSARTEGPSPSGVMRTWLEIARATWNSWRVL